MSSGSSISSNSNRPSHDDGKKFEMLMKRYSPLIPEAVSKHCLKNAGFQAENEET